MNISNCTFRHCLVKDGDGFFTFNGFTYEKANVEETS